MEKLIVFSLESTFKILIEHLTMCITLGAKEKEKLNSINIFLIFSVLGY